MKADINWEVGVKVMGYLPTDIPDTDRRPKTLVWVHPKYGVIRGLAYRMTSPVNRRKGLWMHQWENWNPSADIAQAMQVVDELTRRKFELVIWCRQRIAHSYTRHGRGIVSEVKGKSIAEAICLCALKTLDEICE